MTPFDRPARPGQPETLTIAGEEHGPASGHWYSPAVVARLVEWQKAILDALTQTGADAGPEMDPREAVRQLIRWETRQALDPLVSREARALVDMCRAEVLWALTCRLSVYIPVGTMPVGTATIDAIAEHVFFAIDDARKEGRRHGLSEAAEVCDQIEQRATALYKKSFDVMDVGAANGADCCAADIRARLNPPAEDPNEGVNEI